MINYTNKMLVNIMKIKLLFQLFVAFFKIGMLAFGGGYAVIPLLQKEVVEYRKWIAAEELIDIMAISQTLPGAIMSNSSTIVGYRVCGLSGAIIATTASLIPTFTIMLLVTVFFWNYTDNPLVKKALSGILLGVTALILYSITKMWKSAVKNYFDTAIVIAASASIILFKVNAVLIILAVAVIVFSRSFLVYMLGGKKP